jgi:hypothetical protein
MTEIETFLREKYGFNRDTQANEHELVRIGLVVSEFTQKVAPDFAEWIVRNGWTAWQNDQEVFYRLGCITKIAHELYLVFKDEMKKQ